MTSNYLTGVTVLKELAVTLMAAIETDCVPGKQLPHQSGQRHPVMAWRDSEQKMGVLAMNTHA